MLKGKKSKVEKTIDTTPYKLRSREEIDESRRSPLYMYNRFIRREGQPLLNQQELDALNRDAVLKNRKKLEQKLTIIDDVD